MTDAQLRTISAMKRLGSAGYTKQDGQNIYVSLPFAEDKNPNIKVWPDGSWHDFSGNSDKWEALGLKPHGTLRELENVLADRFHKIWEGLPRVSIETGDSPQAIYARNRGLSGDIRVYNGSLAFPIMNHTGQIIGIQTRRIDGEQPKNMMLHGSDGKNGLFIHNDECGGDYVLICEGATDTYTLVPGVVSVGAISVSMLDGVKNWIMVHKDEYRFFVLAFDADEPGDEAQNKMLTYMLSIGIVRNRIKIMNHRYGKDLNDEMNNHNGLEFSDLGEIETNLFVKLVDSVTPEMEGAIWYGFFPPDFPTMQHSNVIDYRHHLYVFPESFSRTQINKLMWDNKSSAYILRGW